MGSHQSRSLLRFEIHSLIYSIGLPSIFLTINPADIHHPVGIIKLQWRLISGFYIDCYVFCWCESELGQFN